MRKGYRFRLNDKLEWRFCAHPELEGWLDNLAFIFQLKECRPNGAAQVTFYPAGHFNGLLAREGWIKSDLNTLKYWTHKCTDDIHCEFSPDREIDDKYIMKVLRWFHSVYPVYRKAKLVGGLPIHGALVERNGYGAIISAPGDTGKTTCCSRLPLHWRTLCDDEALALPCGNGDYNAHPFPTWSNYLAGYSEDSWNVEESVPLRAIFFLEQSDIDEVIPIGAGSAAGLISEASTHISRKYWGKLDQTELHDLRSMLFNNSCDIAATVPMFRLRATMTGSFWIGMERIMNERMSV